MTKPVRNFRPWLRSVAWLSMLVFTGCAAINEEIARKFQDEMDSYIGKSSDVLILARGVPTGTADLIAGGKVFEYNQSQTRITGGNTFTTFSTVFVANGSGGGRWVSVPSQQTIPINASELRCKIIFQLSPESIVLNWRSEGNDCRSKAN